MAGRKRDISMFSLHRIQKNSTLEYPGHDLFKGETTLGRGLKNDIVILNVVASRNHCTLIVKDNSKVYLIDHNSLNGVHIKMSNGFKTQVLPGRENEIEVGDIIGIGTAVDEDDSFQLVFVLQHRARRAWEESDHREDFRNRPNPRYSCPINRPEQIPQSNGNQPGPSRRNYSPERNLSRGSPFNQPEPIPGPTRQNCSREINQFRESSSDPSNITNIASSISKSTPQQRLVHDKSLMNRLGLSPRPRLQQVTPTSEESYNPKHVEKFDVDTSREANKTKAALQQIMSVVKDYSKSLNFQPETVERANVDASKAVNVINAALQQITSDVEVTSKPINVQPENVEKVYDDATTAADGTKAALQQITSDVEVRSKSLNVQPGNVEIVDDDAFNSANGTKDALQQITSEIEVTSKPTNGQPETVHDEAAKAANKTNAALHQLSSAVEDSLKSVYGQSEIVNRINVEISRTTNISHQQAVAKETSQHELVERIDVETSREGNIPNQPAGDKIPDKSRSVLQQATPAAEDVSKSPIFSQTRVVNEANSDPLSSTSGEKSLCKENALAKLNSETNKDRHSLNQHEAQSPTSQNNGDDTISNSVVNSPEEIFVIESEEYHKSSTRNNFEGKVVESSNVSTNNNKTTKTKGSINVGKSNSVENAKTNVDNKTINSLSMKKSPSKDQNKITSEDNVSLSSNININLPSTSSTISSSEKHNTSTSHLLLHCDDEESNAATTSSNIITNGINEVTMNIGNEPCKSFKSTSDIIKNKEQMSTIQMNQNCEEIDIPNKSNVTRNKKKTPIDVDVLISNIVKKRLSENTEPKAHNEPKNKVVTNSPNEVNPNLGKKDSVSISSFKEEDSYVILDSDEESCSHDCKVGNDPCQQKETVVIDLSDDSDLTRVNTKPISPRCLTDADDGDISISQIFDVEKEPEVEKVVADQSDEIDLNIVNKETPSNRCTSEADENDTSIDENIPLAQIFSGDLNLVNKETTSNKCTSDDNDTTIDEDIPLGQVSSNETQEDVQHRQVVSDSSNKVDKNCVREVSDIESGGNNIVTTESGNDVNLNQVKEEPISARSFTEVDDEPITLSDDEFPCSQFFDDEDEPDTNNDSKREDIGEITDENSDVSSTDGDWFQRLSQVYIDDLKPEVVTNDKQQSSLEPTNFAEDDEILCSGKDDDEETAELVRKVCTEKKSFISSSEDDESTDNTINDINHQKSDKKTVQPLEVENKVPKQQHLNENVLVKVSKNREKRKSVDSDSSSASSCDAKRRKLRKEPDAEKSRRPDLEKKTLSTSNEDVEYEPLRDLGYRIEDWIFKLSVTHFKVDNNIVDSVVLEEDHESLHKRKRNEVDTQKSTAESTHGLREVKKSSFCNNDDKLSKVNLKIRDSHKKKQIKIIDAKALRTRKRGVSTDVDNKDPEKEPEDWLFNKKPKVLRDTPYQPSKAEIKAMRSEKLKNLAEAAKKQQKIDNNETSKTYCTAKNVTKITSKSRNEFFLDTFVNNSSNKNSIKSDTTKANPVKPKDKSIKDFKIPRRMSKDDVDDSENNCLNIEEKTRFQQEQTKLSLSAVDEVSKIRNKDKQKTQEITPSTESSCQGEGSLSVLDKIMRESQAPNLLNRKQRIARVASVNLEVKYIYEENLRHEPKFSQSAPLKSRLKQSKNTNGKKAPTNKPKRKVRFSIDGDLSPVLEVRVKHFTIDDGASLKPVTKNEKKDPPPKSEDSPLLLKHCNYVQETIHQICKWRLAWFVEKQKVDGEPPGVYGGTVYPLADSYTDYRQYRTCMFPLLLYQLWQSVSRHYDQTHLTKRIQPSFNLKIRQVIMSLAQPEFLLPHRANEQRIIMKLDCQMLLERDSQGTRPRAGDLVALNCVVRDKHPLGKERPEDVMAYVASASVSQIKHCKIHVSPTLRERQRNASQVMVFELIIRGRDGVFIHPQYGRIKVLKSILSELRLFNALDFLPSSPLMSIILDPRNNSVELPTADLLTANMHSFVTELNDNQKRAVMEVHNAVIHKATMIQMVHGPPGSGKSRVIVGMIIQQWYHYLKNRSTEKPQILLCAPSNAAVDEIFSRLMILRNNLSQGSKFAMVRIGPPESISKTVFPWSLGDLVRQTLEKQDLPLNMDEQEKATELNMLEARKQSIIHQQEYNKDDEAKQDSLKKKLDETHQQILTLTRGQRRVLEGRALRERKKEIEMDILDRANIIATTLTSCYNMQMEDANREKRLKISCCIVDEATQCTEPESLIPLMLGVKVLVLVGDPKQLPATVVSKKAKDNYFGRSLFARQQDYWLTNEPLSPLCKSRCHFLKFQYRMHPEIAMWPNVEFYKKHICSHRSTTELARHSPLLPYVVLGHELHQNPQEESNIEEAKVIVQLLKRIVKCYECRKMQIGIITPYNKQKIVIQGQLEASCAEEWLAEPEIRKRWREIEVNTVDSYQGREKDIVIYSCTRTIGVGFMSEAERMNVALTRAKQCLIVCGNFKSLKNDSLWHKFLEDAKKRKVFKLFPNITRVDLFKEICKPKFLSAAK